jgi:hypothetical protein
MPDLHKTLIIANVKEAANDLGDLHRHVQNQEEFIVTYGDPSRRYIVEELAIETEHAPFRLKNTIKGVGMQVKK